MHVLEDDIYVSITNSLPFVKGIKIQDGCQSGSDDLSHKRVAVALSTILRQLALTKQFLTSCAS